MKQLKKKYVIILFFYSSQITTNELIFIEDVNPINKFFKTPSEISNSILFKKHKDFDFDLKFHNFRFSVYKRDSQIKLLFSLYENRNFRFIEFEKVRSTFYNDYLYVSNKLNLYYDNILDKVLLKYGFFMSKYFNKKPHHGNFNNSLININFLRKERLYTKLKYSRSPAYDVVSGGSAALLAAFLGFLISEKYGFELVDSGDFYYLFMYSVFISFSLKPLVYSVSHIESWVKIVSIKPFSILFTMTLNLFSKSSISSS